ncbi:MAG TPA: dienelactone hydrolase family protein [Verrucomicrobiae bacterium]|jgi:dienelactone hydrolase
MRTILLLTTAVLAAAARAEIKLETIEYKHGDATLEGYLAYDDAVKGKRPGVLIVHQWKGAGDYEKKRAEMLAKLGYTAFACDIYGKGIRPTATSDAGAQAMKYKSDRNLLRARAQAGLDVLKKHPTVDAKRTAAMGYCFGGTTVLEMARANMGVLGVVSFHGDLAARPGMEGKAIKAKVLVCHGEADASVPPPVVAAFKEEMANAKADLKFESYPGVVHSFTDWRATASSGNSRYDKTADEKSWQSMQDFFKQLFK